MNSSPAPSLTPEEQTLGYKLVSPPPSTPWSDSAFWETPPADPLETIAQEVAEQGWPVAYLRERIEQLGAHPSGRARLDLARQYAQVFMNPARLQQALEQLHPEELNFYSQLLLNLQLQSWRPQARGLTLLHAFKTPLGQMLQQLNALGLGMGIDESLTLPPHFLSRLPPLSLPLADYRADLGRPEAVQLRGSIDLQLLLLRVQQLLNLIQGNAYPLRPSRQWAPPPSIQAAFLNTVVPSLEAARQIQQSGKLPPTLILAAPEPLLAESTLTAWSPALELPPLAVEFFYHLLLAAQLVFPGSPIRLAPASQTFLSRPAGEQLAILWQAYPLMTGWEAFWQLWRARKLQLRWNCELRWGLIPYPQALSKLLVTLRHITLFLLSFLPHDTWLAVAAVARTLQTFLPTNKGLTTPETLIPETANGSWGPFLNSYLQELLQGPLYWLGVTELALNHDGQVQAFQLHHWQDIFWKRLPALPLPELRWDGAAAIQFQPDTEQLLLTPPFPPDVLSQIMRWAEPDGMESSNRLRYRLHPRRLHQVFESGETPTTLAHQWTVAAGFAPPAGLHQWWETWWQRYGHIRLYPHQALLTLRDNFALQELQAAVPELRQALWGLVNPRTALLNPDQVDTIFKTIQAKGYLPKEER